MMRRLMISALVLALTACASAPVRIQRQMVPVPAPVVCIAPDFQPLGPLPDSDAALAAAPDIEAFLRLLLAGRALRAAWSDAATTQIEICRKAGS